MEVSQAMEEYVYNEFTMQWQGDTPPCPKCGSYNGYLLHLDYCPKCGTYRPGTIEVDCPFTNDMIYPVQKKKMVEILCSCGKIDYKQKGSTRVLCGDCQKKFNNDKWNAEKTKRIYYSTRSGAVQHCQFCNHRIDPYIFHYKSRLVKEHVCSDCYKAKFGRKSKKMIGTEKQCAG